MQRLGLTNVRIVEADALSSGLEHDSFDVVHERLVMVNVPERDQLAAEMLGLAKPGGFIALEDIDNVSWLCDPPQPSIPSWICCLWDWGPWHKAPRRTRL